MSGGSWPRTRSKARSRMRCRNFVLPDSPPRHPANSAPSAFVMELNTAPAELAGAASFGPLAICPLDLCRLTLWSPPRHNPRPRGNPHPRPSVFSSNRQRVNLVFDRDYRQACKSVTIRTPRSERRGARSLVVAGGVNRSFRPRSAVVMVVMKMVWRIGLCSEPARRSSGCFSSTDGKPQRGTVHGSFQHLLGHRDRCRVH